MKKLIALFASLSICVALAATSAKTTPAQQPVSAFAKNAASTASAPSSPTAATPAPNTPVIIPPAPNIDAKSYVIMDEGNGHILAQKNMNEKLPPASLTKLTTLYVIFSALKSGQIHLDDKVLISKKAWLTGGSKMFVKVGNHVTVRNLIRGIITASGNDAVVAMAQYVGGTTSTFTAMMNQTAQMLGMKDTHYEDPTGLPRPDHYSTAHDIATIARAIIRDFPEYYHFFDEKWIDWNHIKQPNRNRLLWRDTWVDGMKTGHTKEAGYCLVTSGEQNGMRLITVVMGTPTDAARNDESQALLNYGFRFYESHKLYSAQETIANPRVWLGADKHVAMGVAKDMYVTIPKGEYKNIKVTIQMNGKLKAPVTKGTQYGLVTVTLHGKTIDTAPLIALDSDAKGGLWSRFIDHIEMFFKK